MGTATIRSIPLVKLADCLAGDAVGNLVYITGPPVSGRLQVAKADPNTSGKHPAISVICEKLTSTTAVIQRYGRTPDIYSGLTPGKLYWLGVSGTPVTSPVSAAPQDIGIAVSASAINLTFGEDYKPESASGSSWKEDEFSPTNGQVTFILSQAPTDANSLVFLANGVAADDGVDYTRSGQTITWTDAWFVMDTSDKVLVRYQ